MFIDVAAGEKLPRKGGPGITRSALLVINKIDLAPHVGADLSIMDRDAKKQRGDKPFVFANMHTGEGVQDIVDFIVKQGFIRRSETVVMLMQVWFFNKNRNRPLH